MKRLGLLLWAMLVPSVSLAKDPYHHAEAMLQAVEATPPTGASKQVTAVYLRAHEGLVDARTANKEKTAQCHFDALQKLPDADDVAPIVAKLNRCLAHSEGGKGSKAHRGSGENQMATTEAVSNIVRVFYGTDRHRDGDDDYKGGARCAEDARGGDPACFDIGVVEVNIPDHHKVGEVEGEMPPLWVVHPDPKNHMFMVKVDRMSPADWAKLAKSDLEKSGKSAAFVYVHGYNNTFEVSTMRAAQMAYDLRFPGIPLAYTWGSSGTLPGYWDDEKAVKATVPHLRYFLEKVGQDLGVEQIHIVAHSMGNRAIAGLLEHIHDHGPLQGVTVTSLLLAAPDLDAEVFKTEVVPRLSSLAKETTLYVNPNDKALSVSKMVHKQHHNRAGAFPIVADGLTTIDASHVGTDMLGHSYFASVKPLIDDIQATWVHTPPETRTWLTSDEAGYWLFK